MQSISLKGTALLPLLFALSIQTAVAATVVGVHMPNGVSNVVRATSEFVGPVTTLADPRQVINAIAPDIPSVVVATPTSLVLPFSGAAKDQANGFGRVTWTLGTPVGTAANDQFTVEFESDLSAENAFAAPGEPAGARFTGSVTMTFYLDPLFSRVAVGTHAGDLDIPGIRALEPFETLLSLTVFETFPVPAAGPLLALGAGSGGGTIPLLVGSAYQIHFDYAAEVPFGVDPHFDFDLTVSIRVPVAPVPLPSAALLLAGALPIVLRRMRPPSTSA
ncbi:MAG: hypothetical protein AB7Q97_16160 [Gammaproteobacteria bacterium]